ncbi:PepSY-associated TM helix domain-containing protein [Bacteroides finegoldii]|uniref:PepSY-associated TM helix domain-containing protein n=1 Tax=Bacteroides finegoldii TaxID=338188 RepID=UPI0022E24435|nr:PepSY-associated TM helix domain-containing protein [Bacteroides finegoldii]
MEIRITGALPLLMPEEILKIANNHTGKNAPTAITYGETTDAVFVDYMTSYTVFINPYTGKVIHSVCKEPRETDFFSFILKGHRTLWIPGKAGKLMIGYSVVIFVITLITGLVLWYPRKWNKKTALRNFTLKIKAPFARLNYDLHNVLGEYAAIVLFVLSATGLVWSFNWFSKATYYITSGGKELKPYVLPQSGTLHIEAGKASLNVLFKKLKEESPNTATFYFALPQKKEEVIRVSVVHERGSYYKTDNLFFDQYTLAPLQGSGAYAGKYTEASPADKLRRMNLEIHDGRILGIFGEIIVFVCALIGASLPVTGFIIWFKKKQNHSLHLRKS